MLVEAIGTPAPFSVLEPGECFFFGAGGKATFGILTNDGQGNKAAMVFTGEEGERIPWVAIGGVPNNVLTIDGAIIRPEWSSLSFEASLPLGAIMSSGGNFYMTAALRRTDIVSINVQTGMIEQPPPTGTTVHYSRWSAGLFVREDWLTLFEFAPRLPPRP